MECLFFSFLLFFHFIWLHSAHTFEAISRWKCHENGIKIKSCYIITVPIKGALKIKISWTATKRVFSSLMNKIKRKIKHMLSVSMRAKRDVYRGSFSVNYEITLNKMAVSFFLQYNSSTRIWYSPFLRYSQFKRLLSLCAKVKTKNVHQNH